MKRIYEERHEESRRGTHMPCDYWRRGRDLNSRYRFTPYDGLANRWFKPLTHLSVNDNLNYYK